MSEAKTFKEEFDALIKKYNLTMKTNMLFPMYNILPDDLQLAIKVIEKHGVQFRVIFEGVKENANKK